MALPMDDAQRRVIADLMTAAGFALVETHLVSCWRKAFPDGSTCSIAAGGSRAFDDPAAPVWGAWIVRRAGDGFDVRRAGPSGAPRANPIPRLRTPLERMQLVCRARTLFATLEAAQDQLPKAQ
jgi:hypothetical protein